MVPYADRTGIDGYNDREVRRVDTVLGCIRICMRETTFACKSVEYFESGRKKGKCNLSRTNYTSVPVSARGTFDNLKFYDICKFT